MEAKKDLSKKYLTFFISLSIITYSVHGLFFTHQYRLYVQFESMWVLTSLLGYPLFYYYIRLLTKDEKINYRWIWIILPSLIISVFSFFNYAMMSPMDREVFLLGIMYGKSGFYPPYSIWVNLQILRMELFKLVFAIQLIMSVIYGFKLIKEYNDSLRRYYSNVGGKDLSLIKWLFASFIFASTISFLSNIIGKEYFVDNTGLLLIPSLTHSAFLFAIGFFGFKQNFTIRDFLSDIANEEKRKINFKEHITKDPKDSGLYEKLCSLMIEKELFLNKDLRISEICNQLGSNRTYVSQMINENAGINFCDFVNSYRIEYSEKLLMNYPDLPMEEIAIMSGFSGKSSFYRIFNEKKGLTPGKFRKGK
jgi:AraC-like DNA-binding protein